MYTIQPRTSLQCQFIPPSLHPVKLKKSIHLPSHTLHHDTKRHSNDQSISRPIHLFVNQSIDHLSASEVYSSRHQTVETEVSKNIGRQKTARLCVYLCVYVCVLLLLLLLLLFGVFVRTGPGRPAFLDCM